MIEIRTFEGDEHALAEFTMSIWRKWYVGKMPVPLWSAPYFRRELFSAEGGARDFLVAAYDGTRLVGSHPMRPIDVLLHGQPRKASWGSYLTVDPDYRRQGVALLMHEEQARRHRAAGAEVDFGYLYVRTVRSLGRKFWLKAPSGATPICKLGTWARALDHRHAAQFEFYRSESWGARVFGLFQSAPEPPPASCGVRDYRPSDLPACARLIRRRSEEADLGYLWSDAELSRLLQYEGLSQTLVVERAGEAAALVNYFRLDFFGRCEMPVGVIDFIAFGELSHAERVALLRAALARMAAEGIKGTMCLRGSWYGGRALWAAGFFPMPPEYIYIGTKMIGEPPLGGIRSVHALWR